VHYSSREKCLRLVADRSLDKSYSSRSEALFNSNGDAGLIPDESPRLAASAGAAVTGKPGRSLAATRAVPVAGLPVNVRAQISADKIMNADQSALTGKPSTTMRPIAAIHDHSLLGISITSTGLRVSVAGAPTAALRRAIESEANGVPVTLRTVAHSEAQLQAVQAKITHDLAYWTRRGIRITAWGPDVTSDKVSVTLATYSAGAAAEITGRYGGSWVAVSPEAITVKPSSGRTDDFSPWFGGDEVVHFLYTSGGNNYYSICTSGFGLQSGSTYYVPTAGHCIESNFSSDFYNPGGGSFGTFAGYTTTHDTMIIQASGANGVIWSDPTSVTRTVTAVASTDPVNGLICTDGYTNREVCSVKIEKTNQNVTYAINGVNTTVTNTVYACQTSSKNAFSPGDSGGPVETTIGSGQATARGEILAYVVGSEYCGWYMPERYIESDWGATAIH
jgi:hypothetical protein